MAKKIPAAPANAEPSPKVKEMTASLFTPISAAAVGLLERARMANPMRVRMTANVSARSKSRVTSSTVICSTVTEAPSGSEIVRLATNWGKPLGAAPKINCAP